MEKVTFLGAFGRMWARTFDYKGVSDRREYWYPFIIQCIVALVAAGLIVASFAVPAWSLWFCLGAFALLGYLVLSILPWAALTVRRLRDAGKSGWWTLLMLVVGVGSIILMVLCTAGSTINSVSSGYGFNPSNNMIECVYGPPEYFNPSLNEEPAVYGPPEMFDPSQNELEDVYGPPFPDEEPDYSDDDLNDEPIIDPDELNDEPIVDPAENKKPSNNSQNNGQNNEPSNNPQDNNQTNNGQNNEPSNNPQDNNQTNNQQNNEQTEDAYNPSDNEPDNVYGPPKDFGPEDNMEEPVYGPPEDYNPGDNMEPDVYGPPDWFDPEENMEPDVYGPPEMFEPEVNMEPVVYGPPEYFESKKNK